MNMHSRAEKLFWTLWIGLFLSGCTSVPLRAKQPPNPDRASLQASTALPRTSEGSLWSGRNYASVYADVKAREVGDIVTISIVESASASKNATTSTGRESGAEASWSGIFDAALSGVKINGKEIGNTLVITEVTVKKHVQSIIAKLRASDRTHAAVTAIRLGLLK